MSLACPRCGFVAEPELREALTRNQREVLEYLRAFIDEEGVAPTHQEICDAFGWASFAHGA